MNATTAYILYFIFTLGGVGVYLMLPRAGRSKTTIGASLGILALCALLIVFAVQSTTADATSAFFTLFATIAIAAACRVITHPKPVYSAVYFVLVVVAVAALLVLLHAEFLAIALIIIYAGAIMVTYLFVIMLARQPGDAIFDVRSREPFLAVLCGFVLMAAITVRAGDLPDSPRQVTVPVQLSEQATVEPGNTGEIGRMLMTRYVIVLEIAGVLLLISMVGAIALSRKTVPSERSAAPAPPPGQIGREAEPF